MKDVKDSYEECRMYGEKGYIGGEVEVELLERGEIRVECGYGVKEKDWKGRLIGFGKGRKRIERIL